MFRYAHFFGPAEEKLLDRGRIIREAITLRPIVQDVPEDDVVRRVRVKRRLSLVLNVLHPEGVARSGRTHCHRCRALRAEGRDERDRGREEGGGAQEDIREGAAHVEGVVRRGRQGGSRTERGGGSSLFAPFCTEVGGGKRRRRKEKQERRLEEGERRRRGDGVLVFITGAFCSTRVRRRVALCRVSSFFSKKARSRDGKRS